ncbi:ACSL4 [Cordylochernes scorpioides]|uniref:ACSL4 n=1 Tax=Cordylochernes scorpioides TaxID=51811 RepID=A0ABY6KW58_9ARAC|nr:ACSL4 [Cordylochernes scorpioides]
MPSSTEGGPNDLSILPPPFSSSLCRPVHCFRSSVPPSYLSSSTTWCEFGRNVPFVPRPQEGPGEAPVRGVHLAGQGGGRAEDLAAGGNICALGDSYMTYLVAIILPNRDQLLKLARELDRPEGMTFAELCHDHLVCSEVAAMLRAHGIKSGLEVETVWTGGLLKNEIPGKITLCPDEWLPDSGLVTPGMKVRRKPIENYYRAAIDEMYGRDRINTKGS